VSAIHICAANRVVHRASWSLKASAPVARRRTTATSLLAAISNGKSDAASNNRSRPLLSLLPVVLTGPWHSASVPEPFIVWRNQHEPYRSLASSAQRLQRRANGGVIRAVPATERHRRGVRHALRVNALELWRRAADYYFVGSKPRQWQSAFGPYKKIVSCRVLRKKNRSAQTLDTLQMDGV